MMENNKQERALVDCAALTLMLAGVVLVVRDVNPTMFVVSVLAVWLLVVVLWGRNA